MTRVFAAWAAGTAGALLAERTGCVCEKRGGTSPDLTTLSDGRKQWRLNGGEGVVLDAIQVADQDNHLPGIAAGSGGIAVRPQSLKDGLRLFEDETVLDIRARRSRPVNPAAARCRDVRSLGQSDGGRRRRRGS